MSKETITSEQLFKEVKFLRQEQKSLLLASCSSNNDPLASYAPFVEDEQGQFYLLLSDIASHSTNLKQHHKDHKKLSVLLIEDEINSRNVFARKRLSYECSVSLLSKEQEYWQTIIDSLQKKFGRMIDLLVTLNDFNLYCLTPVKGTYIRGFGQTYELKDAKYPVCT